MLKAMLKAMLNTTMTNNQNLQSTGLLCLIGCPYFDERKEVCRVAKYAFKPGKKYQASYCVTDDHDDCPLYLCQALRTSQTLGCDRESIKFSGK